MSALPLPAAAAELDVSVVTLRRWIRAGAPLARRGQRGRGKRALVCPEAVAQWRAAQAPSLAVAASGLPDILAAALADALEQAENLPKQRMAGFVAGAWYLATVAALDHLRAFDPAVGDVSTVPGRIDF